jgi:TPR repeat protein
MRGKPMGLKDMLLSARITGIVMNFPLYDCGVSEKARQLIAAGKLSEALSEYHRLATMGSAPAKCVLAYLSLRNLPGAPRNVDAAKALANAALSREPGYANYVLSYVAALEKDAKGAINRMVDSYMAKFIPASTALALIHAQGYGIGKHPKEAEIFFLRAIFAGHIPAPYALCRFYMSGNRGFAKQILGAVLTPVGWLYLWIATRFMIFSIRTFRHFNLEVPPMFNEKALKS